MQYLFYQLTSVFVKVPSLGMFRAEIVYSMQMPVRVCILCLELKLDLHPK